MIDENWFLQRAIRQHKKSKGFIVLLKDSLKVKVKSQLSQRREEDEKRDIVCHSNSSDTT